MAWQTIVIHRSQEAVGTRLATLVAICLATGLVWWWLWHGLTEVIKEALKEERFEAAEKWCTGRFVVAFLVGMVFVTVLVLMIDAALNFFGSYSFAIL